MGKYEEEVYQRAEKQFPTVQAQLGWLSSFAEKKGNAYERDAVLVASSLQRSIEIGTEAREAEANAERLRELKADLNRLRFKAPDVEDTLTSSLNLAENVEKEEQRISREVQEYANQVDRIRNLDVEEQKELYRNGNREERALAGVALREESPRVLGGLISGESRRKNAAIRAIF